MNVKRPIILFLAATILGIIIAYTPAPAIFKLLLLGIAIFLYLRLFFMGKLTIRVLLFVFLFFLLGFYRFKLEESIFDRYDKNVESLGKGNKQITGKIEVIGKSTNSNYYELSNCIANGIKLGRCRCYFSDAINPNLKIGNMVKVTAGTMVLTYPMNEGEFNQKSYYRSDGISFISFAKNFEVTNANVDILKQKIYEIKVIIKNQIFKIFNSKDAGLFSAMVTGDKSTIDKEQKRLFSDNGIAHILAISGLHLSILGLALFELLRKKFSVHLSAGVVSIFILLYGIFIDASASSLRAICMLYVRFLSLAIGRTYDSKNTLYIICFIFLMLHPYLLFNAGFQFSYVAIFALNHDVIICRKVDKENKIIKEKHKYLYVPQVIVLTLFLFPITIYHYFTYPLYSILLNLIVIPLMSSVLLFGIAGLVFSFIFLPIGKVFSFIVHIIFFIYEKLCLFIERLPAHLLWLGKPTLFETLFFYVAIFMIIWALADIAKAKIEKKIENEIDYGNANLENINNKLVSHVKYTYKYIERFPVVRVIICIVLLVMSVLIMSIRPRSDLRITFLSIGQGDGAIVEANDTILSIDGGSSSNTSNGQYLLTPHIKSRAINHIDYAFISHPDSDHTNGLMYIMENEDEVKIKNLVLSVVATDDTEYNKIKSIAAANNVNIMYVKAGDNYTIKDGLDIKVLSPTEDAKRSKKIDSNELSMVFNLYYNGHSVMFSGDIGKNMIKKMVERYVDTDDLDVEILKVPHHGSKNSCVTEFYEATSPKYSVISYGKDNTYGHPHDITVKGLEGVGSTILKTPVLGQIDFTFTSNSLSPKFKKYDIID